MKVCEKLTKDLTKIEQEIIPLRVDLQKSIDQLISGFREIMPVSVQQVGPLSVPLRFAIKPLLTKISSKQYSLTADYILQEEGCSEKFQQIYKDLIFVYLKPLKGICLTKESKEKVEELCEKVFRSLKSYHGVMLEAQRRLLDLDSLKFILSILNKLEITYYLKPQFNIGLEMEVILEKSTLTIEVYPTNALFAGTYNIVDLLNSCIPQGSFAGIEFTGYALLNKEGIELITRILNGDKDALILLEELA